MTRKNLIGLILVINLFFGACSHSNNSDETENSGNSGETSSETVIPKNEVLAHWKFQNVEEFYTGDIDIDDLRFIDLSGNGNDLVVGSEGFADSLDNFLWDTGVGGEGTTSLKFNNTLELAESVDPYDKSQTTYSGAYVSGKYLKTVLDAPLRTSDIGDEWAIEIVFKISADWNNAYNRYTGIFSRQGVDIGEDEPFFSMAIAAANDNTVDRIGNVSSVDLQLVHMNSQNRLINKEFGAEIFAEEWVHYMVVGDEDEIRVYLNGEKVTTVATDASFISSNYGWEVGVGRKYGADAVTMNPQYPEGLIRRLFCGSISEIKFWSAAIELGDSLLQNINITKM